VNLLIKSFKFKFCEGLKSGKPHALHLNNVLAPNVRVRSCQKKSVSLIFSFALFLPFQIKFVFNLSIIKYFEGIIVIAIVFNLNVIGILVLFQ
jgi:hypothetical protein